MKLNQSQPGWIVIGVVAVLMIASALPAVAGAKEDMHAEMITISDELATIKGNPAEAARARQLLDRYARLSDALGGDDPGSVLDARIGPGTQNVVPTLPPACVTAAPGTGSSSPGAPVDDVTPVMDTIAIAGAGLFIIDVDVTIDITHTFAGDLEFFLTSPAGTIVTLSTDNGGGNDDIFAGTLFDDQAGIANPPGPVDDTTYTDGVAATTVAPEEPLGALLGEDPNGTWTLDVMDDAGGDSGTVNSWSLAITTLPGPPIFDPVASGSNSPGTPFDDVTPVSDTIVISGAINAICGLNLNTDITHTFASDIEMFLTSPAGTVLTISTDNGGGNDDVFAGTTWGDGAGSVAPPGSADDFSYTDGVAATALAPEEAFSNLIGEDPNGTWTLDVMDDAGGDSGTLNSWGIDFTTCSCTIPEADLSLVKTGAAVGSDIIWTLEVTNNGPDDATDVVVTDMLDACTTYVSDDCGALNVPPWTWNVGPLANGASATCNITVDASGCPPGDVLNSATATALEGDPVTANNDSSATVGIGSVLEIPTLGGIGLVVLIGLLALGAMTLLRRRSV